MGFQSRESGVPGEGSFPAGRHSCAPRGAGDGAPGGGPGAHFHAARIQPPLCGPGLPRAAAAAGEQSAIHRGPASSGRSPPQLAGPARHPPPALRPPPAAGPGARPAGRTEPDSGGRAGPATRAASSAGPTVRTARSPPSLRGGGWADTESFQRADPPRPRGRWGAKLSVSGARARPCPWGGSGPRSQVVRALCFSSAASEIPTKGSLPDFCVSAAQCLESSYPLVTADRSASLPRHFFSGLAHSSRSKLGTLASQQRPLFFLPHPTPGKKAQKRKRTCSAAQFSAFKHMSSAAHIANYGLRQGELSRPTKGVQAAAGLDSFPTT